jgi:hypothetical protein
MSRKLLSFVLVLLAAGIALGESDSIQKLHLTVKGIELKGNGRAWHMTGPGIEATTGLTKHEVQIKEASVGEVPVTLEVAPISVSVYELDGR